MTKLTALSVAALALSAFLTATVVMAQTATPTASPTATPEASPTPDGAPATGLGG